MPRDFQSSAVQSWFASVQREFGPSMLIDVAYVGNKGDDLLLIGNFNQAAPNNAAGTMSLQSRRPIPTSRDITYVFNGGRSRYDALQLKYEWRMGSDVTLLSSLTMSKAKDNGAQCAREPERQLPGAAGPQQPRRRLQHRRVPSAVQQHDQLRLGAAVRARQALGQRHRRAVDILAGGWQVAGDQHVRPRRDGDLHLRAGPGVQVSGITNDFRGANNYRPNVTCDPYAPAGEQTINNWFNPACVVIPTDPSQPFGNAARNNVRGPKFWHVRSRGDQAGAIVHRVEDASCASKPSTCSTA